MPIRPCDPRRARGRLEPPGEWPATGVRRPCVRLGWGTVSDTGPGPGRSYGHAYGPCGEVPATTPPPWLSAKYRRLVVWMGPERMNILRALTQDQLAAPLPLVREALAAAAECTG